MCGAFYRWSPPDLEDVGEDSVQGSNEQQNDANSVAHTAGFCECGTAASSIADVLNQKISANNYGDNLCIDACAVFDEQLGGSDDEEDEGGRQLQITMDRLRQLGGEEEAYHHGNEGNPQTNVAPQEVEDEAWQLQGQVGYEQGGQQVCPPVGSVQHQQIDGSNNGKPLQNVAPGTAESKSKQGV